MNLGLKFKRYCCICPQVLNSFYSIVQLNLLIIHCIPSKPAETLDQKNLTIDHIYTGNLSSHLFLASQIFFHLCYLNSSLRMLTTQGKKIHIFF